MAFSKQSPVPSYMRQQSTGPPDGEITDCSKENWNAGRQSCLNRTARRAHRMLRFVPE